MGAQREAAVLWKRPATLQKGQQEGGACLFKVAILELCAHGLDLLVPGVRGVRTHAGRRRLPPGRPLPWLLPACCVHTQRCH